MGEVAIPRSFFLLLLLILCVRSWARENSQLGLQYSLGAAQFYGQLSTQKKVLFHDLQINTLSVQSDHHFKAYLAIDVLTLKTTHNGVDFPYNPGASLRLSAFLFIPNFCYLPNDRFDLCLGVGQGTVNVNSGEDRRDYGTWNYQALFRYYLSQTAFLHSIAKYVGRVEQRENGKNSYFSFTALGLGAGWEY